MSSEPVTVAPATRDDTYYRELCENLGVAVIATDESLRITFWNSAAARMFGAAAGRMLGTDVLFVLPADRRDAAKRLLQQAVAKGELGDLEFHYRDESGQPREFVASIAPLVTIAGPAGASICIRDITKRIGLQNELMETRKMAALGDLAGAIAHHFNNILGGVVTSLDYATTAADQPSVVRRILSQTSRSIMRAVTLVNNLLAFSKGTPFSDDLGDLTEVLNEVANDTELLIRDQNVRFHLDLASMPVVPVPRMHLSTVLRNLIQNAVEAMPTGGDLTLSARLENSSAVISVTDTGRGLDDIARGRLFEPFWTTKLTAAESPSTIAGLGLAVSHGLVKVMGGTISVRSIVNEGSTFSVTIPIAAPSPK